MSVNLSINKSNYYSIKFRVHKKLIPYFKKEVITKSLHTKDKKLAQLKFDTIYYPYQQILNTFSIVTPNQTKELVKKFLQETLNQTSTETPIFTIDTIKYKSLENSITLKQSLTKFKIWYKQQSVTDKQFFLTTNKLENMILPYFGLDMYLEEVTLEMIEEFREFLSIYPNTNKIEYRSLSYIQIANLKNTPEEDIIGFSTQIKYLKILKQFFGFALKANLLSYNPCVLLNMPSRYVNNREPFNYDELKHLFRIFDTLDNRRYIYYILAYTGMRPSELWKCTIGMSEDNVIYFDLRARDLQLKTSSSHRIIPLHKELLKMRVDKMLSSLQLEFNQAMLSKYFNTVIKPQVTDNRNKIMYSFRHTVATELKRAEISMDKVSELLGHTYENNSITKEVYASGYTLIQLQNAINHLKYI